MTTIRLASGEVAVKSISLLGDRLLVQALPPAEVGERTRGGLFLPQAAASDHQALLQGVVVATGPRCSPNVPVGARVICQRFAKTPVNADGTVWVSWEDAVIATLREEG